MFFTTVNTYSQNAVGNSGTAYNSWLYHPKAISVGTILQPQSTLHLHNGADPPGQYPIFIQFTNTSTTNGASNRLKIGIETITNPDAYFNQQENANMYFLTDNLERLRITKDGYLGINNTNPLELLDISGGNIAIRNNASNNFVLTSNAGGVGTWKQISLTLNSNQLSINGLSSVNLVSYLDNTDNQTLSIAGHDISILNGNTITIPDNIDDADSNPTNEIQNLSFINGQITMDNGGNTIDISSLNTDNQTLSISGHDLTILNENTITLPDNVDDADSDPTNELQNLSISAGQLVIDNGTSIPLSSFSLWQQNINNIDIYYDLGKVGIGIIDSKSTLHLHSLDEVTGPSNSGNGSSIVGETLVKPETSSYIPTRDVTMVGYNVLQVSNTTTGELETDGLLVGNKGNIAFINQQENAALEFYTNKTKQLNITKTGVFQIGTDIIAQAKVNILSQTNGLYLRATSTTANYVLGIVSASNTSAVIVNNENIFVVKGDGRVGIGVANPNRKLTVSSENTSMQFELQRTGSSAGLTEIGADANGFYIYTGGYSNNKPFFISTDGKVGIGTTDPQHELDVVGIIRGCEIIVDDINGWCDYVFEKEYELMPLNELESFIKENKHLPEIPSKSEVMKNGIHIGDMNVKLLKKVEELTLHIINLNNRITELEGDSKRVN